MLFRCFSAMLGLNIKELFKKLALELPGISAQAEAKAREEESKNGVLLSSIALQNSHTVLLFILDTTH